MICVCGVHTSDSLIKGKQDVAFAADLTMDDATKILQSLPNMLINTEKPV